MAAFIFTFLGLISKNHSSILNYFDVLVQDSARSEEYLSIGI